MRFLPPPHAAAAATVAVRRRNAAQPLSALFPPLLPRVSSESRQKSITALVLPVSTPSARPERLSHTRMSPFVEVV
jgi:hypothetical protein